jgi:hypothetical protein
MLFPAALALVLAATVAGLVIGFPRTRRRWSYRQAGPKIGLGEGSGAQPARRLS